MNDFRNKGKIFGIGLSRTGTKSLTAALRRLGFRINHFPTDEVTLRELTTAKYNLSLLDSCDGITDITVAPYYAQLDALYPGSKFILTTRHKEAWLHGLECYWAARPGLDYLYTARRKRLTIIELLGLRREQTKRKIREAQMVRFLRAATYGTYKFNRERMSYVYDLHFKNVTEYFRGRPDSLLIIDITAGAGWPELCQFFQLPTIHEPFVHIS